MTALTIVAEPFPDWEAPQHAAAARDLGAAVAAAAPRSCSARYLVGRGSQVAPFTSPLIRVEQLPVSAKLLPVLWRSGSAARPLDGEFVHSVTPLIPLRGRDEDDGSQTTVTVPHSIAWELPELLGKHTARLYRAYVRRAVKYADAILTPTHATAKALQDRYGYDLPVQVFQLAPPTEFLRPADEVQRATELELPTHYAVTTATPGEHGRLDWIFDALRNDPSLPDVVVIDGFAPGTPAGGSAASASSAGAGSGAGSGSVPEDLAGRVHVVAPRELQDVGAILAGADLLLQPQAYTDTGYVLLGALSSHVPVLHSGHAAAAELALDAGVGAASAADFAAEFSRLLRDSQELDRLSVIARDLSRATNWNNSGWQLWETHANL
ncbi:MAG: mannosyltransferase [Leucobacter sp.]